MLTAPEIFGVKLVGKWVLFKASFMGRWRKLNCFSFYLQEAPGRMESCKWGKVYVRTKDRTCTGFAFKFLEPPYGKRGQDFLGLASLSSSFRSRWVRGKFSLFHQDSTVIYSFADFWIDGPILCAF